MDYPLLFNFINNNNNNNNNDNNDTFYIILDNILNKRKNKDFIILSINNKLHINNIHNYNYFKIINNYIKFIIYYINNKINKMFIYSL